MPKIMCQSGIGLFQSGRLQRSWPTGLRHRPPRGHPVASIHRRQHHGSNQVRTWVATKLSSSLTLLSPSPSAPIPLSLSLRYELSTNAIGAPPLPSFATAVPLPELASHHFRHSLHYIVGLYVEPSKLR
jgi:hypothetical protein